jgi:hypothetical protein
MNATFAGGVTSGPATAKVGKRNGVGDEKSYLIRDALPVQNRTLVEIRVG